MNWLSILWRGFAMGAADIIPGISGGTIALITHIYERLIEAVRGIVKIPADVLSWWRAEEPRFRIDAGFLAPLAAGILLALALLSHVLPALLETYPRATYAFFAGLILAASLQLYRTTKNSKATVWWLLAGTVFGAGVTQLPVTNAPATPLLLLVIGAVAISAMLLPGISGSYLLLIAGQYETILGALQDPLGHWQLLGAFSLGALAGAAAFSHAIHYALANHENATLAALTGIMLGALVRPVQEMLAAQTGSWLVATLCAVIGFALVSYLETRR